MKMLDALYHESLERLFDRIESLKEMLESHPEDYYTRKALYTQECKYLLYVEQNGECCFCEKLMYADSASSKRGKATIEHVQPRSLGGANKLNNYKLSCMKCNNKRAVRDFDEFRQEKQEEKRLGYVIESNKLQREGTHQRLPDMVA